MMAQPIVSKMKRNRVSLTGMSMGKSRLTINDQRRLLLGRCEDNKGERLTEMEVKSMKSCLVAKKEPIQTQESVVKQAESIHGKKYDMN